jgi:tetratricopeptide (TPR) repeat protein
MGWLSGVIHAQTGHLEEAVQSLRSVLATKVPERDFDFSLDYEVINLLGQSLYDLAKQVRGSTPEAQEQRNQLLEEAAREFQKTLNIDSENVTAHYNLSLIYKELGQESAAVEHHAQHERYRTDDQARGLAVRKAREKYPAANQAAEALVIYSLHRPGAPGLGTEDVARLSGISENGR